MWLHVTERMESSLTKFVLVTLWLLGVEFSCIVNTSDSLSASVLNAF